VPQPLKESDTNALPDPELNPLLNPLLAAHMGRWAEVYFTTPPEKRGQAISELLQELKSIPVSELAPVPAGRAESAREKAETKKAEIPGEPVTSEAEEAGSTCSACAYDNSPGQFFCGRCGAQLRTLPETHPRVLETMPVPEAIWSEAGDDFGEDFHDEFGIDTAINAAAAAGGHEAPEPAWMQLRRDLPGFSANSELKPAGYRYRLYIGGVLAILLIALVYMAWRGTKAISGVAKQSAPPVAAPAQPKPASQEPAATGNVALKVTPQAATPASSARSQKSELRPRKDQAAASEPAPQIEPPAVDSAAIAAGPAGTGDFAKAEKYLNGSRGTPRDTKEAVPWLWKAVGKGNIAATMALSDLYLRGDGVPKSCDQARLLLDAAARKGGAAAAERLHNLQAFGCE